ncbi:MAG TPA: hypothetical protein VLJ61_02395 [Pyrinomonadaceae bacterium]|nr:hypothetical protein [Pyrinomonadaceae bacterium]
MKRYVFHIVAALLTFAIGVSCAVMLGGSTAFEFGQVGEFILPSTILVSGAICFRQSFTAKLGLRQNTTYNLLMFSASGLLFAVGAFMLIIVLVMNSPFGLCTK